jgi:thioredoxin-related protein
MKYALLTLTFTLITCLYVKGQTNANSEKSKINWVSIEQAVVLNAQHPKKIFVDVYTTWCGWCKRMEATTFQEPEIIDYLNNNFYSVKLDAETRDTIRIGNDTFVYTPEYKSNSLAATFLGGKMSYPTTVYIDESLKILSPVPGYQHKDALLKILKYFGDNIYKDQTWEDYQKIN